MLYEIRRLPIWVAALLISVSCADNPDTTAAAAVAEDVAIVDSAVMASMPGDVSPEMLERGRELYVTCSVCHGLDGNGTALGPSLRDSTWVHIDGEIDQIARVATEGIPNPREFEIPMPPMGGRDFSQEQVRSIAAYVYALRLRED